MEMEQNETPLLRATEHKRQFRSVLDQTSTNVGTSQRPAQVKMSSLMGVCPVTYRYIIKKFDSCQLLG